LVVEANPIQNTGGATPAMDDDTGLLFDQERLPNRVRMKKARVPQS